MQDSCSAVISWWLVLLLEWKWLKKKKKNIGCYGNLKNYFTIDKKKNVYTYFWALDMKVI